MSTALVAITNALNGFEKNNWIVTSYLLTYAGAHKLKHKNSKTQLCEIADYVAGFLIILSRFSDVFGRKPLILLVVFLFTVFSAACGAAQTFTQLYVEGQTCSAEMDC